MSEPATTRAEPDPRKFPLWFARRWYLYRLHRGSTILALGATMLLLAPLLPLLPINADTRTAARITPIGTGLIWIIGVIMLARATRLLVTGTPEHRHSALRLALGVIVPALGAMAAGAGAVGLVGFMLGDPAVGGTWTGVSVVLTLIVAAMAMWACAQIADTAPRHPRTSLIGLTTGIAVIIALITIALVVLAIMAVLGAELIAWIGSIAIALVAACATIAALSARAIVGAVILARETAELGPEIEPVSGP